MKYPENENESLRREFLSTDIGLCLPAIDWLDWMS